MDFGIEGRRLKDRICKSQKGKIQCIATSATLVKVPKNFEKIAKFASNLFDENFELNQINGDASHKGVDLEEAEIIVSGGRGLHKPENFSLINFQFHFL